MPGLPTKMGPNTQKVVLEFFVFLHFFDILPKIIYLEILGHFRSFSTIRGRCKKMQKMPKHAQTAKKMQETTHILPGLPTKMGLPTQKSCNDFLIFLKKTKKMQKKRKGRGTQAKPSFSKLGRG